MIGIWNDAFRSYSTRLETINSGFVGRHVAVGQSASEANLVDCVESSNLENVYCTLKAEL